MSRQGIGETRAYLKKLLANATSYDLDQARAAITSLGKALGETLDTIDAIDNEAPQRIYDQAFRAHNAVDHHRIDRHIVGLCHRLHLRAPAPATPPPEA
jgi:hypothetical protein